MCGIFGYVGQNTDLTSLLIDGLRRLEYRGYDSSGIAIANPSSGDIDVLRSVGMVSKLEEKVADTKLVSKSGIAHTRWATHGKVSESNTHPHLSNNGNLAIVHNGVIENYRSIKEFLRTKGYQFQSETDTEVLVNLIDYHYQKEESQDRLLESVRKSLQHVQGTYGLVVLSKDYPDNLVTARKSSPICIGVGEDQYLVASDSQAFALHTKEVIFLKDNEVALIGAKELRIKTVSSKEVRPVIETIDWDVEESELGNYEHYMEKEIFEQPESLANTMRGRFSEDFSTAHFGGLNLSPQKLRHVDRFLFCGCGSAWHSSLVAEYLIEKYARIPVEVEYASEFRYRNAPLQKDTLVFVISQSGETIDTLAALQEAKRKGYRTLAITNTVGSTIARECDGGIYQHAGKEISVASTKAFTSQLMVSCLFALYMGRLRDMSFEEGRQYVDFIQRVPEQVESILKQAEQIEAIADKYAKYENALFLGRQFMFPIALEGALKLKEISYIHAEGYPAAEMKHGPISLISPECPTVFLATQKHVFEKTLSNIQEVKARKGPIISIISEGSNFPKEYADDVITIPECPDFAQTILASIPIQLLTYYIAKCRGCSIDKPRNLAKSVTVE